MRLRRHYKPIVKKLPMTDKKDGGGAVSTNKFAVENPALYAKAAAEMPDRRRIPLSGTETGTRSILTARKRAG